jgi:hypothetical protein
MMGIAAGLIGGMNGDVTLALPRLALARAVCRDPDPGPAGPALERIDGVLSAAEAFLSAPEPRRLDALWLIAGAVALAATEPVAG